MPPAATRRARSSSPASLRFRRLYHPIAESVVVTGSRIRNASEPSTPVVSLPADQLLATTAEGIPEALNKMPLFAAGSTPNNATTGANGRGYNAPGYFLNLRNLGAIRTLVLLDGHRVPGTFYDTTVDIDMIPQMLVSRVEDRHRRVVRRLWLRCRYRRGQLHPRQAI